MYLSSLYARYFFFFIARLIPKNVLKRIEEQKTTTYADNFKSKQKCFHGVTNIGLSLWHVDLKIQSFQMRIRRNNNVKHQIFHRQTFAVVDLNNAKRVRLNACNIVSILISSGPGKL